MISRKIITPFWLRWLDKRIPAKSNQALNMRSIFILPSGFGWGFLLTSVSLFLLGTNYQNNLMLLLSYLLLTTMLLTLFYSYLNFANLSLNAVSPQATFATHTGAFTLTVIPHPTHSHKKCSGLLNAQWFKQPTAVSIDLDSNSAITLPFTFNKRGEHPLSRVTLTSFYPLGLYRCWTHLDFAKSVVIYPQPLSGAKNYTNVASPLTSDHLQQGSEDFFALIDYVDGEPLNRVDWKQVAKNGNWVVKQFNESHHQTRYLSLSHHLPLEQGLRVLAFHIVDSHKQGIAYGLRLDNIEFPPAHNELHKKKCLTALATYHPSSPYQDK